MIHRLVVADVACYGTAIKELAGPSETHTQRAEYTGIAKTIPAWFPDGSVNNTVIVTAGVLAAALGCSGIEPIMDPWLGRYILRHEMGHCRDHEVRGDAARIAPRDVWPPHSIDGRSRYYMSMIPAEVAACLFGATGLSEDQVRTLAQLDVGPLESELSLILERCTQYARGSELDPDDLAVKASQVFWIAVVQFAKTLAHIIGVGQSTMDVPVPSVMNVRPDSIEAIRDLADIMSQRVIDYPNWPSAGWRELERIWVRFAAAFDCRFENRGAQCILKLQDGGADSGRP